MKSRPGTLARVGFYTLLGYTALSTTVAWTTQWGIITPPSSSVEATVEEKPREELSAQTFAANFVREYFLWSLENEETRQERLSPYLHPSLDAKVGWNFKEAGWDSWAREVEVWEIEHLSDDRMEATVYAQTEMTKGKERKRVDRWLIVPMEKAGDSYVVTAPPRLTAPPKADISDSAEESEEKPGKSVDSRTREDVKSYLDYFWRTYTTGKPEEIRYLFDSDELTEGLTGILRYLEIESVEVYEDGKAYRADCQVKFRDLASEAEVSLPYTLYLTREGTRWHVIEMERTQ